MPGRRSVRWVTRSSDGLASTLIGLALSIGGAAANSKEPPPRYPVVEERTVGSEMRIRVPLAKVAFETTQTRRRPPRRLSSELEVSGWIRQIASDTLHQKGLTVWETEDQESLTRDLTEMSDRLLRPRPPSQAALELLRQLDGEDPDAAVLIQYLKVEIGPEGRFDAYAGRIQVALVTSTLRAALIRCSSGEVVWRGEMFIRKVPWIKDPNFESAIAGMFKSLSLEGGPSDE